MIKKIYTFIFLILTMPILTILFFRKKFRIVFSNSLGNFGDFILININNIYRRNNGILNKDEKYIFISNRKIPNEYLKNKFSKEYNSVFIGSFWLAKILSPLKYSPFNDFQRRAVPDIEVIYKNQIDYINFTKEEIEEGESFLKKLNINDNDWFVCLHIRNSFYREQQKGYNSKDFEHRNSSIDKYAKAINYIISLGGKVVFMGVFDPNITVDEFDKVNFIDYRKVRNDFMDIYLAKKAKLFIGSSSGGSIPPWLFKTYLLDANVSPFGSGPYRKDYDWFIFKKIVDKDTKKLIPLETLSKHMDVGYNYLYLNYNKIIDKYNWEIEENSEDEIFLATKEMIERLNGNYIEKRDYEQRIENFYALLPKDAWIKNMHAKVCETFLDKINFY